MHNDITYADQYNINKKDNLRLYVIKYLKTNGVYC